MYESRKPRSSSPGALWSNMWTVLRRWAACSVHQLNRRSQQPEAQKRTSTEPTLPAQRFGTSSLGLGEVKFLKFLKQNNQLVYTLESRIY
ncbi:mCG147303 [Mus musculus]|nr:mCG147303 [Mus musculus]